MVSYKDLHWFFTEETEMEVIEYGYQTLPRATRGIHSQVKAPGMGKDHDSGSGDRFHRTAGMGQGIGGDE
jgi:hypothetical protein